MLCQVFLIILFTLQRILDFDTDTGHQSLSTHLRDEDFDAANMTKVMPWVAWYNRQNENVDYFEVST